MRITDGATGTLLATRGMEMHDTPCLWVLEHPDALRDIQRDYLDAGTDILTTCTLTANALYLAAHGIVANARELNAKVAALTVELGADTFGDISTTGLFVEPVGDVSYDKMVEVYRNQAEGLVMGGVNHILIETMTDLRETVCAVAGIKQACDLPVVVSMTVDKHGRTLSGDRAECAAVILTHMGVDAFGINCGFGPDTTMDVLRRMRAVTHIPFIVMPNAGMPVMVDGVATYDLPPDDFARAMADCASLGVQYAGGCCGTSPAYIKALADAVKHQQPAVFEPLPYIASPRAYANTATGTASPVTYIDDADDLDVDLYDYVQIALRKPADVDELYMYSFGCPIPILAHAPEDLAHSVILRGIACETL